MRHTFTGKIIYLKPKEKRFNSNNKYLYSYIVIADGTKDGKAIPQYVISYTREVQLLALQEGDRIKFTAELDITKRRPINKIRNVQRI